MFLTIFKIHNFPNMTLQAHVNTKKHKALDIIESFFSRLKQCVYLSYSEMI